jgi:hypothetical protein
MMLCGWSVLAVKKWLGGNRDFEFLANVLGKNEKCMN